MSRGPLKKDGEDLILLVEAVVLAVFEGFAGVTGDGRVYA